jgi:hypothetical protein
LGPFFVGSLCSSDLLKKTAVALPQRSKMQAAFVKKAVPGLKERAVLTAGPYPAPCRAGNDNDDIRPK